MAKFRCKASGNIIEFTYEVDIESTRRHSGYEEVIEQPVVEEAPVKKAGRPSASVAKSVQATVEAE